MMNYLLTELKNLGYIKVKIGFYGILPTIWAIGITNKFKFPIENLIPELEKYEGIKCHKEIDKLGRRTGRHVIYFELIFNRDNPIPFSPIPFGEYNL